MTTDSTDRSTEPEDGPIGYVPYEGRMSVEIELPDGETVEIPRPDKVFPTLGELEATADVCVQAGRVRMREEGCCLLRLGVANQAIKDPEGAIATLHAGLSKGDEDVYAEIALDSVDEIRELRDALNLALRYRGDYR